MPKMIQRYGIRSRLINCAFFDEKDDGGFVKYADHVAEVAKLEAENKSLRETLARMQAPVSDEEWEQNADSYIELDAIGRPDVTNDGSWSIRTAVERPVFDSITAARAAEPKEEPKP